MDPQLNMLSSCGVEASGWDAAENFFVENTALHWWGRDNEEIELHCSLQEGAVVFLRRLQTGGDTFPMAYRAMRVEERTADGKARVHLEPLRRRETHKEQFARWTDSMQVA
jgi:hypothetical protein